nr:hypothetical protein CFP56_25883 [Quercus suber]
MARNAAVTAWDMPLWHLHARGHNGNHDLHVAICCQMRQTKDNVPAFVVPCCQQRSMKEAYKQQVDRPDHRSYSPILVLTFLIYIYTYICVHSHLRSIQKLLFHHPGLSRQNSGVAAGSTATQQHWTRQATGSGTGNLASRIASLLQARVREAFLFDVLKSYRP